MTRGPEQPQWARAKQALASRCSVPMVGLETQFRSPGTCGNINASALQTRSVLHSLISTHSSTYEAASGRAYMKKWQRSVWFSCFSLGGEPSRLRGSDGGGAFIGVFL